MKGRAGATTMTTSSTARLEARISPDLHSLLKRAAEVQGCTVNNFVITAVQDTAQRVIEQAEVIRLSLADQRCFSQTLLAPPQLSPLKRFLITLLLWTLCKKAIRTSAGH